VILNQPDSKPWLVYLLLHCFVAVVISALIGFLPEVLFGDLYRNSRIAAFFPVIAITGLLVGYLPARG
jgi:hypothetical protein